MASKVDSDWQSSKNTVLQRSTYMFNNPLLSDITFTCGESSRIFYAHKYVLATSSAVFLAMFYGDLAHEESSLHLPDTDDESFEEFLRFLYTDECRMSADSAMKVMYLSKKYLVPSLTEKCLGIVKTSLRPDNVFSVLEEAVKFSEKELEERCWNIVEKQTEASVNSEAFLELCQNTLKTLLAREKLSIKEVDLFKGVLQWCDKECLKQGLDITGKNRRAVLGDAVFHIRFLAMSLKDFAKHASKSELLTTEEMLLIFQKFSGLDDVYVKWKDATRDYARSVCVTRFEPTQTTWCRYVENADGLIFKLNRPAKLLGVRLFGGFKIGQQYQVNFEVKDIKFDGKYTTQVDEDGIGGFDVMLPRQIDLEENEHVEVIATISGPSSYGGSRGKSSVTVDDLTVTFSDSSRSRNGTDITQGQFYKFYFSY